MGGFRLVVAVIIMVTVINGRILSDDFKKKISQT